MLEKIKKIFQNKEKRVENLVFFLIILVVTLIVVNKILENGETAQNIKNETKAELALNSNDSITQDSENLEKRLENILEKIRGVGKASVLITYSESSSIIPIYNVNSSTSTIEEKDTSGGVRKTETENNQKDVVTDRNANIVTEKTTMPKIEGAIIIAEGASDATVKTNIISAIEAVTGIATHKIQVFEMGEYVK